MIRSLSLSFALSTAASILVSAEILDTLVFGDASSEASHHTSVVFADSGTGALDEPLRRLLPGGDVPWQGGMLKFSLRIDPNRQNYFTIRLSGDEVNHNQLTLHIEGKQIGYRHLGDIEVLDFGTYAPAYRGRFYYRTCPLPIDLTTGKEIVNFEVRATGPIWGYGKSFEQYQMPMTGPTRGIYRAYTHTGGCFTPPEGEKQGNAPADVPVRKAPGEVVIEAAKARVNREIDNLLNRPVEPCNQMHALFLAKAYHITWTRAAGNPKVIQKILTSLDVLFASYVANPKLAQAEPSTYNPEWFGLGPSGQIADLLKDELSPYLDGMIDTGEGTKVKRRDAFRGMWVACRDWHREHRRQYTNQSMINDLYGIYLANRGIAVVSPDHALPEKVALRYLYESVGLEPWLGSERNGVPLHPLGDSFYQLTARGLTKELGYVGAYGEVLDWTSEIYEATRPSQAEPGDPKLKDQVVKIARARAPFRYPLLDQDGNRAMVLESIIGWRDTRFPGRVTYDQRPTWDGSPLQAAAATLDPHLIGYGQQMLADNQFFAAVAELVEKKGFRVTSSLLAIPDRYEIIRKQPAANHRLPMSWDQPDFLFTDEDDGVVALKNGSEILYASLYWRARHAVNFLARVHHLTPQFDRIATVKVDIDFTPSGMEYTRPNWTNFGFANGGHRYPPEFVSAHAGEKLPIAEIPKGVAFKQGQENPHAGKGDFYQLRYGPYLIAMNMSARKTFELRIPDHTGSIRNLSTSRNIAAGSTTMLAPKTTVVLRFN